MRSTKSDSQNTEKKVNDIRVLPDSPYPTPTSQYSPRLFSQAIDSDVSMNDPNLTQNQNGANAGTSPPISDDITPTSHRPRSEFVPRRLSSLASSAAVLSESSIHENSYRRETTESHENSHRREMPNLDQRQNSDRVTFSGSPSTPPQENPHKTEATSQDSDKQESETVQTEGMTCQSCTSLTAVIVQMSQSMQSMKAQIESLNLQSQAIIEILTDRGDSLDFQLDQINSKLNIKKSETETTPSIEIKLKLPTKSLIIGDDTLDGININTLKEPVQLRYSKSATVSETENEIQRLIDKEAQ